MLSDSCLRTTRCVLYDILLGNNRYHIGIGIGADTSCIDIGSVSVRKWSPIAIPVYRDFVYAEYWPIVLSMCVSRSFIPASPVTNPSILETLLVLQAQDVCLENIKYIKGINESTYRVVYTPSRLVDN